jgi:hypothetical protein
VSVHVVACFPRDDNADGTTFRVFVNGRPRPVIFENMRERIARGDIAAERAEAIKVSNSAVVQKLCFY